MLRIKLVRSPNGFHWRQRRTVEALGLRKINQIVEKEDNSSIRGMVHAVKHMLVVENLATGETLVDATKIKRRTNTRDYKPSETH